jgi:hypothetical protein
MLSIWPPPLSIRASGAAITLAHDFHITTSQSSCDLLDRAMERYDKVIVATSVGPPSDWTAPGAGTLSTLALVVASCSSTVAPDTVYNYSLTVTNGSATASAPSLFGAIYALETFSQLVYLAPPPGKGLVLQTAELAVIDAPQFSWRGLMVDTGRRYFAPSLMRAS